MGLESWEWLMKWGHIMWRKQMLILLIDIFFPKEKKKIEIFSKHKSDSNVKTWKIYTWPLSFVAFKVNLPVKFLMVMITRCYPTLCGGWTIF